MKVGITAGAFDLCHAGHMLMFKEARQKCDRLVVCLHRDPSIERSNKNTPVMSLAERRSILEGIRYIDAIVEYDTEEELLRILKSTNPAVRFLGDDWRGKPYTGKELGIPVIWNSRAHGYSSSELRDRVWKAEALRVAKELGMEIHCLKCQKPE